MARKKKVPVTVTLEFIDDEFSSFNCDGPVSMDLINNIREKALAAKAKGVDPLVINKVYYYDIKVDVEAVMTKTPRPRPVIKGFAQ